MPDENKDNLVEQVESLAVSDNTETAQTEEEKLFLDAREPGEDGQLHGSVYKNPEEAVRGVREKDTYIAQLKAERDRLERIAAEHEQFLSDYAKQGLRTGNDAGDMDNELEVAIDPVEKAVRDALGDEFEDDVANKIAKATRAALSAERQAQAESEETEKLATFLNDSAQKHPDTFLDVETASKLIRANAKADPRYAKALNTQKLYMTAKNVGDMDTALRIVLPSPSGEIDTKAIEAAAFERGKQEGMKALKSSHARLDNLPGGGGGDGAQITKFDPSKMNKSEVREFCHAKAESVFTGADDLP